MGTGGGAKLHKLQHRTEKPFLGENNRKRSIILMFLLFVELIRSASEARKIKKKTHVHFTRITLLRRFLLRLLVHIAKEHS